MVVGASVLYGISNVLQEFLVKKHNRLEFLAMLGLCGSIVCGIQVYMFLHLQCIVLVNISAFCFRVVLERNELVAIDWSDWTISTCLTRSARFIYDLRFIYLLQYFI